MKKCIIWTLVFLGVIAAGVWLQHRQTYPYGLTHRCSKTLCMEIGFFAEEHDGRYPFSQSEEALGLSAMITDADYSLAQVVGKAGNLNAAKKFYLKKGYILPEHSSWHYIEGLTVSDQNRALAWDKIPLGHNGQRQDSNSREVMMTDGSVITISGKKWDAFLEKQQKLAAK